MTAGFPGRVSIWEPVTLHSFLFCSDLKTSITKCPRASGDSDVQAQHHRDTGLESLAVTLSLSAALSQSRGCELQGETLGPSTRNGLTHPWDGEMDGAGCMTGHCDMLQGSYKREMLGWRCPKIICCIRLLVPQDI